MDKTSLDKSLSRLAKLLGLLIFSPILLNVSFKSFKIFTEYPKKIISFFLLFTSISLTLYAVYYGFKTFKGILDSLFKE